MTRYTAMDATLRRLDRRFLPLRRQLARARYGRFEALMTARYGFPERPRRSWGWFNRWR